MAQKSVVNLIFFFSKVFIKLFQSKTDIIGLKSITGQKRFSKKCHRKGQKVKYRGYGPDSDLNSEQRDHFKDVLHACWGWLICIRIWLDYTNDKIYKVLSGVVILNGRTFILNLIFLKQLDA